MFNRASRTFRAVEKAACSTSRRSTSSPSRCLRSNSASFPRSTSVLMRLLSIRVDRASLPWPPTSPCRTGRPRRSDLAGSRRARRAATAASGSIWPFSSRTITPACTSLVTYGREKPCDSANSALFTGSRCFLPALHFQFGEGAPVLEMGRLSCELLPPANDHVAVLGIEFHQASVPAILFTRDHGRSGAAEQIENEVARLAAVRQGALDELDGLHCRVEAIRRRLLLLPQRGLRLI